MQASAKITQTRRFFTFINPDNGIEFCFSDEDQYEGPGTGTGKCQRQPK